MMTSLKHLSLLALFLALPQAFSADCVAQFDPATDYFSTKVSADYAKNFQGTYNVSILQSLYN